jgi:hypothetical protein
MGEFKELELICLWKFYICCNNDSVHICHTIMHQSILALPIPPPPGQPPGICTVFLPGGRALVLAKLSRGRGIVYRPGIWLDRTFLRRTRAIILKWRRSSLILMNLMVKTRILSTCSFTKRHTNRTWETNWSCVWLSSIKTLEFIEQSLFILLRYCILTTEPTSTFFMFKSWDDCCCFYTRKLIFCLYRSFEV